MKQLLYPPSLRAGDKVGLVAPAFGFKFEDLDLALQLLKKWHLKPIFKWSASLQPPFSGTAKARLYYLQTSLDDPTIKAIFCVRGGYGSSHIIDSLNLKKFLKNPKWLIGFSDITHLHSLLHLHNSLSLHAPVLTTLTSEIPKRVLKNLKQILFEGNPPEIKFKSSKILFKTLKGQLVGGNLSVLAQNIGTKTQLNTNGKILFLEDVGEAAYRLDARLNQLRRAGYFNSVKALLLGSFTESNLKGKNLKSYLLNLFKDATFPVLDGLPVGHIDRNLPLVHGVYTTISQKDSKICLKMALKNHNQKANH